MTWKQWIEADLRYMEARHLFGVEDERDLTAKQRSVVARNVAWMIAERKRRMKMLKGKMFDAFDACARKHGVDHADAIVFAVAGTADLEKVPAALMTSVIEALHPGAVKRPKTDDERRAERRARRKRS